MKITALLAWLWVLCVGGVARADRVEVHKWQIELSGEVLQQQGRSYIRACAGGIDDHGESDFQYRAHTRQVTLRILDNQVPPQPLANANVELRFVGNTGHDGQENAARLHLQNEPFSGAQSWLQVLAGSTDSDGRLSIWVKSGDLICQPKLQINRVLSDGSKSKIGDLECDFGSAISYRRFPNRYDPDETKDDGWLLDFPRLSAPGNVTPAKIYVKFRIDLSINDLNGNWHAVNNHRLRLRIAKVTLRNHTVIVGSPEQLRDYAIVMDSASSPTDQNVLTVERTTAVDGSTPQIYIKAGSKIKDVLSISVAAQSLSQWLN